MFFGHLPLIIKMYTSRKAESGNKTAVKSKSKEDDNGLIISFLNCYAAGIFFATCILHMLPEISEKMKNEILKGSWKREHYKCKNIYDISNAVETQANWQVGRKAAIKT